MYAIVIKIKVYPLMTLKMIEVSITTFIQAVSFAHFTEAENQFMKTEFDNWFIAYERYNA